MSPAGSHKTNTSVPQAFYNAAEGTTRLATETGAGQWGSALSFACSQFDLECKVYMVRASYEQKPYRRVLMETWGASVVPSPVDDPSHPGSLGTAISDAVRDAATRDDSHYALGSVRLATGRAGNYDLGIFAQAAQSWAAGRLPGSGIRSLDNLFADHFSPVTLLYGIGWLAWPEAGATWLAGTDALAAGRVVGRGGPARFSPDGALLMVLEADAAAIVDLAGNRVADRLADLVASTRKSPEIVVGLVDQQDPLLVVLDDCSNRKDDAVRRGCAP